MTARPCARRGAALAGHRLHGLAVRRRPRVRRRGAARRGEDRRARGLGARGRARLGAVPAGGRRGDDADAPNAGAPSIRPSTRAHDHIRGPLDAPLTLVEYGDCECPFCGEATGRRRRAARALRRPAAYVFRHLPLEESTPTPTLAAEAAEAAGAQGRFWEMHDRLFAEQDRLGLETWSATRQALGLDAERFLDDAARPRARGGRARGHRQRRAQRRPRARRRSSSTASG